MGFTARNVRGETVVGKDFWGEGEEEVGRTKRFEQWFIFI